jgi:tetratricopeptide (TPR) repeat protein
LIGVADEDLEQPPDRSTASRDWEIQEPTVAQLRARFPRLTASLADDQLVGPTDISRLSLYERQRAAGELLERTKQLPDDATKLDQLERAHRLWPTNEEIRAARGRVHARLGNLDAALADFDAVLAVRADALLVHWERSKVRLARGDRDGALEDARASAHRVDEARAWLATFASATAKRVRHMKFGEGTVISQDSTGAEPKLVIDFASGRKTIASRFVETIE